MVALSRISFFLYSTVAVQGFLQPAEDGCPNKTISKELDYVNRLPMPDSVHSGSYRGQDCSTIGVNNRTVSMVKRADNPWDLDNGATFTSGTWKVIIKGFSLYHYTKTTFLLPSDTSDINWLASAVGYYVTKGGPKTWLEESIGGGWTMQAWIGEDNYTFGGIPYGLLVSLVKAACHSAKDWELGQDNGFTFQMWTSDLKEEIMTLLVFPSNAGDTV